jgi:nucleoside-diphosphate-sugar epimerase
VPDGGLHPVRHVYSGEVARVIAGLLGDSRTFGEAYNLCQDEAPTLSDLLALVAGLLGAAPRFVAVPSSELKKAGLSPAHVSPFSGAWMSLLDPAKIKAELGVVHEPLDRYLGKILASFIAHPPPSAPETYRRRKAEIALATSALAQRS